MPRNPSDVTDAELTVLQALWEKGVATVRELADALYPSGRPSDYATVQKLVARLETKGHVQREKPDGGPQRVRAVLDRDALIGRGLRAMAERLCEGSVAPLLTNLVRAGDLSDDERAALRRLVDELDGAGEGP